MPRSDLLPKHTKWAYLAPGVSALVPQEKGLLSLGCIINKLLIGEMEWYETLRDCEILVSNFEVEAFFINSAPET